LIVYNAGTGRVLTTTVADGDGTYRIEGLPVARIKVEAVKDGWYPSWANGQTSQATADVFTLTPCTTLNKGGTRWCCIWTFHPCRDRRWPSPGSRSRRGRCGRALVAAPAARRVSR
jgi:hypothetical protein